MFSHNYSGELYVHGVLEPASLSRLPPSLPPSTPPLYIAFSLSPDMAFRVNIYILYTARLHMIIYLQTTA